MFRGRYEHTIDGKGRLSIPSRFREILSDRYSKRWFDELRRCLVAFRRRSGKRSSASCGAASVEEGGESLPALFHLGSVGVPARPPRTHLDPATLRADAELAVTWFCRHAQEDRDLVKSALGRGFHSVPQEFEEIGMFCRAWNLTDPRPRMPSVHRPVLVGDVLHYLNCGPAALPGSDGGGADTRKPFFRRRTPAGNSWGPTGIWRPSAGPGSACGNTARG